MPAESDSVALPWWMQFRLLLRLLFADYRNSAPFLALSSLIIPLGTLWLLGSALGQSGVEATWMLGGNAVMSIAIGSTNFALNRVGLLRLRREIDYYATLPVSKSAFVAAIFTLAQVSALPGLLAGLAAGHWLLGIPLPNALAALPLALGAAVCLTVIGAAVGSTARTWGQLNLYSNLVTVTVIFFSPVMAPIDSLPLPLRISSYVSPTGQAAIALTDVLSGNYGIRVWLMAAALTLWLFMAGTVGLRRLDWRAD